MCKSNFGRGRFILLLILSCWLPSGLVKAGGTWAPLANTPPTGVNHCMLLSDGSVYTDNGNGDCCRLTPDIHGSYRTGTWTRFASMNYSRLFFASQVLTNGNIFVAGGEYGTGRRHAELFDPLNNVWTKIPDAIPGPAFSDAISETLPNGNVLVAPVSQFGGCLIYNVAANTFQTAAGTVNQNEVAWTKMPNDTIVTIDTGAQTSEHYVPSSNQWRPDGNVPVVVYGFGAELGAGFLLPNGKAFYIGGSTNTAIYTPNVAPAGAGTWVAGPPMVFGTNNLGAVDAPAAMLVNGKILCDIGPVGGFNGPASFYEYDYVANSFTQVTAPGGGSTYGSAPFVHSMLCLPDGNLLFVGGQNSQSLYIYTPDGTPLPQGQPTISSITENADGSFHMTGLGLNGISEGAAYGDDEQMETAYPLVRMTNSVSGNVYYARTRNWNSTSVQTGSRVIATEFNLPQNLPSGNYSLVVVANGNPSIATNFTYSPPPVPTGLTAVSGSNSFVPLNWNASAGATAYNLKRSASTTGYFTTIATLSGTTYTNTGLTNGITYYYKVAAVGANGPSNDSAAVSATPAGPPTIPGATPVILSSYYNRIGIYTDGIHFSGGVDNAANAYSANLLSPSVFWNGLVFGFGPANALDVISCAGQTITLPQGQFNTLQLVATGVQGGQIGQTFTVTYTDNSTATFTQSFSDWANQQSYFGEATIKTMSYRDQGTGGSQTTKVSVNGYSFVLDPTKTVQSITVPIDSNLILLSMMLANDTVAPNLSTYYNRAGIYTDSTTYTNPATGGLDGGGYSYSGTLLGSSQMWSNTLFTFGPLNATNVISCTNQVITLPQGNYSRLRILGAAVNGSKTGLSLSVTYTDAFVGTYFQNFSDWFSPQNYARESKAFPMSYRNFSDGSSTENNALYLYGYDLQLISTKTIQSVQLPNNPNVLIAAISLVPNWPPTVNVSPLTLPGVNSGQGYSGTIATNAVDLNGDTLTYTKLSGPAWLNVAANGALSGTPADSDANTNTFVLSVKDTGGLSNTMTLNIYVNGAPSFTVNPFSLPGIAAGQAYSGQIDTNAVDPNPTDVLTFAKVSGPDWLIVGADGQLSGTPLPTDVGDDTFVVSVTDPGGLSNTATMDIVVSSGTQIISTLAPQPDGTLQLNWSGGTGPYQVQATTNLVTPDWQNVGDPVSGGSIFITPTNDTMFYRILEQQGP
jgi:Putative Ig domain